MSLREFKMTPKIYKKFTKHADAIGIVITTTVSGKEAL